MKLVLAAVLASLATACISSSPGVVRASNDNPLVTIGAGEAVISAGGDAWRVWYVIDRATETCWMKLGDAGDQMDCCDLRKVAAAREHIGWETDATCAPATLMPAAPAVPAAPTLPAAPAAQP
jgi:hypothetical protein